MDGYRDHVQHTVESLDILDSRLRANWVLIEEYSENLVDALTTALCV
jgi:hypothetical protein